MERLLFLAAILAVGWSGLEPEDIHFERYREIRRRVSYHLECPPRAVCATALDLNRTLNGVRQEERRVIFNCMCEGHSECPILPEYRLYISFKKRDYLCQPRSRLKFCDDPTRIIMGPADRSSMLNIYGSDVFSYVPYTKMNCLCPRHIRPVMPTSRWDLALATSHSRYRYMLGVSTEYRDCAVNSQDRS